MDAFAERAFPPEHPQTSPLGWGGKFSEIPPALVGASEAFKRLITFFTKFGLYTRTDL